MSVVGPSGFRVSDTSYFVSCNGHQDSPAFDAKLECDIKLLPRKINDNVGESRR